MSKKSEIKTFSKRTTIKGVGTIETDFDMHPVYDRETISLSFPYQTSFLLGQTENDEGLTEEMHYHIAGWRTEEDAIKGHKIVVDYAKKIKAPPDPDDDDYEFFQKVYKDFGYDIN